MWVDYWTNDTESLNYINGLVFEAFVHTILDVSLPFSHSARYQWNVSIEVISIQYQIGYNSATVGVVRLQ